MKKTLFTFLFALLFYAQANAQSNSSALLYESQASAQSNSLVLLYQSPEGDGPAPSYFDEFSINDLDGCGGRFDADGDGTPDLILQRDDDQGNLQDLRVIDAPTGEIVWEMQNVQHTLGYIDTGLIRYGFAKFYGFAKVFGDDEPEAIFISEMDVLVFDPSDNSLEWSWGETNDTSQKVRLLAVCDFTDDGYEELLIFLLQTKQVQVWSKP